MKANWTCALNIMTLQKYMSTEVILKYSTADHEVLQIRRSHCCHAIGAAILVSVTLITFVNPLSLVVIKFYWMMTIAPLLDFIDRPTDSEPASVVALRTLEKAIVNFCLRNNTITQDKYSVDINVTNNNLLFHFRYSIKFIDILKIKLRVSYLPHDTFRYLTDGE